MKPLPLCSLLLAVTVLVGCATSTDTAATSGPTATCHVCAYNNDLACVCVKVTETTPRTDYQGVTYYFCSEDCQSDFLAKPGKYSPED